MSVGSADGDKARGRAASDEEPDAVSDAGAVVVRPVREEDAPDWVRMRTVLWPDQPGDHPREVADYLADPPARAACFVAKADAETLGFAEVGLRDYAEECQTSPVGYLEGIYVEPHARARGVGRALVGAAEAWARSKGCAEMASDRALTNEVSGAFHLAVGFEEAVRMVTYRKAL